MITYNAPNSSSIKYSILFDVALGLGLFPKALLASECAFLATSPETSQPFGWILQVSKGPMCFRVFAEVPLRNLPPRVPLTYYHK